MNLKKALMPVRRAYVFCFRCFYRVVSALLGDFFTSLFLKYLVEVLESERRKSFITYHRRPQRAANVSIPVDRIKSTERLAVVVQGPVVRDHDFTLETLLLYSRTFPGATIIFSTWNDISPSVCSQIEGMGINVLKNDRPDYSGFLNINMQIVSSMNGVNRARDMGAEYVLKTRSDQRIYAANVGDFLHGVTEAFPLRLEGYIQKKRIVGVSLDSFKHRMYGLSDMLVYGHVDDMVLFWNTPLDSRRITAEQDREAGSSLRRFAHHRVSEVYLTTNYLQAIGRKLEWNLRDSWACFADHFCVIDKEQLDLLWPKYDRLEHMWLKYGEGDVALQEMNFREWLLIYSRLAEMDVPEHFLELKMY